MMFLKKALSLVLLISVFFVINAPVYAQETSLQASVRTTDPLKPILLLTNTGAEPCQVANTNIGTVSITKATQNGKDITPLPIQVALDDGLELFLARNLKTLQPNESTEIPLDVYPYKSENAIQTITWSKRTGAFGMIYPFKKDSPYEVEVVYSAPISISSGSPLCGPATGNNIVSATQSYLKPLIIFIALLFLVVLIFLIVRPKRRKTVVIFLAISALIGITRPVHADYSVPSGDVGIFDECMATFERHPDITGPILDAIDPLDIQIFTNRSGVNDATDWPDGSYHVRWDPESEYDYHSDGGSAVPSSPCDRLFHELYHVYEIMNGTISRDDCGGIPQSEVNATRAQNRLREAMGLPPRTHYGHDPLPPGDGCEEEPPPPPPSPGCGFSCATSWGEPHLQTFDGKSYNFQAVGEFVAATDTKGDFEVQVRQQPWTTSRYVSMNTAVAMRVGTEKVELQVLKQQFVLFVNGKKETLENKTLTGGGTITTDNRNYAVVTWPDGSKVIVNFYHTFGVDLFIEASEGRKGQLAGIFGNFNEESADDLQIRGKNMSIEPDFEKLYPEFADSWRIDDKTSLFTYDEGKNTDSYSDKTFPDKQITAKDLPNRAPAEALCKSMGITNPDILENCILDVALTGRPEFAYAASRVQQNTTTSVDYGGPMWTLEVTKPGETATATFEGKANESVFLAISKATLPYQCGGLGIKDPEGQPIATGCIVEGAGFVNTTQLPVTGTYTVYIDPANQNIGKATIQLIKTEDFKAGITLGGPAVTAKLTTPGAVATFTFSGTAGQRVFVEIVSGTIPDQCGGISVNAPDGSPLEGTCTSKGKANFNEKGIVLPETGDYTIKIDPAEGNTGEVTVSAYQ